MKQVIVGTNTLLQMAKQLVDKGEITQERYDKMVERNKKIRNREDLKMEVKE